jgi:hypothetical protein
MDEMEQAHHELDLVVLLIIIVTTIGLRKG